MLLLTNYLMFFLCSLPWLKKLGKAAEMLGVDVQTLRAWEKSGALIPDRRSKSCQVHAAVGTLRPPSFEEELAQDVIEIITVFSARLYGSRSHQTERLLGELSEGKRTKKLLEPMNRGS